MFCLWREGHNMRWSNADQEVTTTGFMARAPNTVSLKWNGPIQGTICNFMTKGTYSKYMCKTYVHVCPLHSGYLAEICWTSLIGCAVGNHNDNIVLNLILTDTITQVLKILNLRTNYNTCWLDVMSQHRMNKMNKQRESEGKAPRFLDLNITLR